MNETPPVVTAERPGGVTAGSTLGSAISGAWGTSQGGGAIMGPGIISGNWGSSQLDTGKRGLSGGVSWGRL